MGNIEKRKKRYYHVTQSSEWQTVLILLKMSGINRPSFKTVGNPREYILEARWCI